MYNRDANLTLIRMTNANWVTAEMHLTHHLYTIHAVGSIHEAHC